MLRYPSLCRDYIHLITEVLEYFPDKLKDLGADLLNSIMKSLEYGMSHSIYQVGSLAFEAISTLGFYSWFEDTKKGAASRSKKKVGRLVLYKLICTSLKN